MQFSDIDSYVISRYTSELDDDSCKAHINEVYLDLTRAFTPDITEVNDDDLVTTEGEAVVTLTWQVRQIKRVYLQNGAARVRLRRVLEQALITGGDNGLPRYWAPYGNTQSEGANYLRFLVNPTPDGEYQLIVEYEPVPADLVADTDVPKYIPAEYHHLIAWGTIAVLASIQDDWDQGNHWAERFRHGVNDMMVTLGLAAPANYPSLAAAVRAEGGGAGGA
jgi:hypothetical protein